MPPNSIVAVLESLSVATRPFARRVRRVTVRLLDENGPPAASIRAARSPPNGSPADSFRRRHGSLAIRDDDARGGTAGGDAAA